MAAEQRIRFTAMVAAPSGRLYACRRALSRGVVAGRHWCRPGPSDPPPLQAIPASAGISDSFLALATRDRLSCALYDAIVLSGDGYEMTRTRRYEWHGKPKIKTDRQADASSMGSTISLRTPRRDRGAARAPFREIYIAGSVVFLDVSAGTGMPGAFEMRG